MFGRPEKIKIIYNDFCDRDSWYSAIAGCKCQTIEFPTSKISIYKDKKSGEMVGAEIKLYSNGKVIHCQRGLGVI